MNEKFEEYYDKNKKGIAADFITVPLCVQYQLRRAFEAGQVAEREACACLVEDASNCDETITYAQLADAIRGRSNV